MVKKILIVSILFFVGIVLLARSGEAGSVERFTALDVGQGDALLVQSGGATALIDTGLPQADVEQLLRKHIGTRSLDVLVMTHQDKDHTGGMVDVLRTYKPRVLVWPGGELTKEGEKIMAAAEKAGTIPMVVTAGNRISVGNLVMTVVAPDSRYQGSGAENDRSLVIHLAYPDFSVLTLGDAPTEIEEILPEAFLDVDLVKIGHHGSKTSTGEELLQKLTTRTAFISLGADNKYGHPNEEVMARLLEYGFSVRRTDLEGHLVFEGF